MKITFVILITLVIVGRVKIGVSMHFMFSATLCSVYCTQKGTRKRYILFVYIYITITGYFRQDLENFIKNKKDNSSKLLE